jgi:hypothetical protein
MTTTKNFRIYEALAHEAAEDASRRRELTPEQRAQSREIYESGLARLDVATRRHKQARARVRPSILAMVRDAVEKRLDALLGSHPSVVIAYRELTALSDDDLRSVLEDVERQVETMARPS